MRGGRLSYSHFAALQTAHRPRFFSRATAAIGRRAPGKHACSIIVAALLVSACNLLAPYRAEVQQGNVVTQDMIAKLQPGMTRSQVRFALGTPLVVDPFRKDRWDYVYMLMKQGEVKERRRIVVVFKDDKLAGLEGDVAPLGSGQPIERGPGIDKPAAAPAAAPEKKL
jgi:outer membrane protein assembly factor BamE